jgi:rhodanese-related sulfurtransferase
MAHPALPLREDPAGLCDDGRPVGLVELRAALTVARGRLSRFLLLDVRDREAFAAGHVRGAICVPRDELASLVPHLPKGRCLVTYAGDADSALAHGASVELRARGFLSSPLEAGFAEWAASGLPVHQGAVPAGGVRCSCSPAAARPPGALRVA